jgi:LytS/YehU family sensor histidine kinase
MEIEKVRFRDRLNVSLDVEPELFGLGVPNLILQPILENAIRHGLAERNRTGNVRVAARRDGERLQIDVCDDGRGVTTHRRDGIGLSNTRSRLQRLFGAAGQVSIERMEQRGTRVRIEIPALALAEAGA